MIVPEKIAYLLPDSRILVVDDEEVICLLLIAYLNDAGFRNVEFVTSGENALIEISKTKPSCVVLDINMPGMNGNEVLRQIRANPQTEELPVLVVTAHDKREERNKIERAGATNLISKPIDSELFVARVASLIERQVLFEQLNSYHDRLSSELALAEEMQINLMPTKNDIREIEQKYGVQLASHFNSSSELGGDFWFLESINENCFRILLVDFSGHGISAALNTFRLHMMLSRIDKKTVSPAHYIGIINSEISAVMPLGQFCTILCVVIDILNETLTYSGAASPPPIFGNLDGTNISIGDGSGIPAGIQSKSIYVDRVVEFQKKSFSFLYSDALYETELDNNKALGIEGILSLITDEHVENSGNILDGILEKFYDQAPSPLPDDLTAIYISR